MHSKGEMLHEFEGQGFAYHVACPSVVAQMLFLNLKSWEF